MNYPIERELCGVYFRVERDGKYENICFTDLTREEQEESLTGKELPFVKSLAYALSDTINEIADAFDITREV